MGICILEVLSKAYLISKNETYLRICKNIVPSFYIQSELGGVRETDKTHSWWYAEYPLSKNYVLNGFLTSLKGLYEYYNVSHDEEAYILFYNGLEEFKNHFHEYDSGNWTYYDIHEEPASRGYHIYHINLLRYLYSVTKDPIIYMLLQRWEEYLLTATFNPVYSHVIKQASEICN